MPDTNRTPDFPLVHPRKRFRERCVAAGGLISLKEVPQSAQISLRGDAHNPAFAKLYKAFWVSRSLRRRIAPAMRRHASMCCGSDP